MTYMINARLEQGIPSLTLIDAATGKERLHWRSDNMANGENDWKKLFKRLMLLSCADQISLIQCAKSPAFGDECIECRTCIDQDALTETQTPIISTATKNTRAKNNVVSLLKCQK